MNLYSAVENYFLKELKAKEVKIALRDLAFQILVFKLTDLQFIQGIFSLKVDQACVEVPLEHLSADDCAANNQDKGFYKVLEPLETRR